MKQNRRFLINTGSNLLLLCVNLALMVFYVPFLIRHLGPAAYGMIALMNSLAMLATILTQGVETSAARFLAVSFGRGDRDAALEIFSAALVTSARAAVVILGFAALLALILTHVISVPPELAPQMRGLIIAGAVTVCCSLVGSVIGAPALIMNRLDLRNIARAAASFSRVAIIIACFSAFVPSLWQVAFAFAASAVIGIVAEMLIRARLAPWLRHTRGLPRREMRRELTGMSKWASLNQAGVLLMMQTDLLVVNAMFGATTTGRYGALIVLVSLVYMGADALASVITPAVLSHFATDNHESLRRLALRSMLLLGIALAVPAGLLAGLGGPTLRIWLGPDFAYLAPVLFVLVIHLPVSLGTRPLSYVLMAHNELRWQALGTVGFGAAAFVLAIVLGQAWGLVGVAGAMAFVWTARNVLFISACAGRVLKVSMTSLLMNLIWPGVAVVSIAAVAALTGHAANNFLSLIIISAAISLAYAATIWVFVLEEDERDLLVGPILSGWRSLMRPASRQKDPLPTRRVEE